MSKKQQTKTKLGKAFAKLRIDLDMNRVDMAQKLGITDQALGRIEEGKSQVTDDFLEKVSNMAVMIDDSQYNDPTACLEYLRLCNIDSIKIVTFEMADLTFSQRERVILLRDSIENENAEKMKAAAEEAERIRLAKKAQRAANKLPKVAPELLPDEDKRAAVGLAVELVDTEKSEAMTILEEAVVTTATEMPSTLTPVTTVDVTKKSAKAANPVVDEDAELEAMLADLENL